MEIKTITLKDLEAMFVLGRNSMAYILAAKMIGINGFYGFTCDGQKYKVIK